MAHEILQPIIEQVDNLKTQIDNLRPLDAETENRIMQKFRLDWNFHSNNIEGNSLSLGETKTFLLHGITAEGKPLKDHLDLKGHNEAINLIEDVITQKRPLTETFIREIHQIILHEPYEKDAITPQGVIIKKKVNIGQYKKDPNHVKTLTGEIFYFASPEETPARMNDLMDWYFRSIEEKNHPLILASEFHYKFIRIHPFDDGNGRMARILMNLIFLENGFPPVIIKTEDKNDYYRALQIADGGDIEYFIKFIGEHLIKSLQLFIKGAKGQDINEIDDIDKKIVLLKTRLKDKAHKVIYNLQSAHNIYTQSILPFIELLINKLGQFDELFNTHQVEATISFEGANNWSFWELNSPSNTADELLKKFGIKSIIERIEISFKWHEFLSTESKLFDCSILIKIKLDKTFFITSIHNSSISLALGIAEFESQVFYYHSQNDINSYSKFINTVCELVYENITKEIGNELYE